MTSPSLTEAIRLLDLAHDHETKARNGFGEGRGSKFTHMSRAAEYRAASREMAAIAHGRPW